MRRESERNAVRIAVTLSYVDEKVWSGLVDCLVDLLSLNSVSL